MYRLVGLMSTTGWWDRYQVQVGGIDVRDWFAGQKLATGFRVRLSF